MIFFLLRRPSNDQPVTNGTSEVLGLFDHEEIIAIRFFDLPLAAELSKNLAGVQPGGGNLTVLTITP